MVAKSGSEGALSLYLIDDHPIVRLGLSLALQGDRRIRLSGSATSPYEGRNALETSRPDVVVVDLVYDGKAETTLIRECRRLLPDALIIVFSSLPQKGYEREAFDLGADAYIGKNTDLAVLLETIIKLSPGVKNQSAERDPFRRSLDIVIDGVHLTRREAEVARRLGSGLTVSLIAGELNISANTVSVHRDNLRKKLRCRNMTELVALLARHQDRMTE